LTRYKIFLHYKKNLQSCRDFWHVLVGIDEYKIVFRSIKKGDKMERKAWGLLFFGACSNDGRRQRPSS
jgi:hypothetical protein